MRSHKVVLTGAGVTVAVLLVLPLLIPLGRFIPEIERIASEQLKAPVKVESLNLYFLPLPHLTVQGIAVGKEPFLEVEKVTITPRLMSLFSRQKVIRKISLQGVLIGARLIGKASTWAGRSGTGEPALVRVESVEVRDASVNLTDFKLRQIDVDLELTPQSGLARASIRSDNGHLTATLVPQGRDFAVEIAARDWRLPVGPPLLMSSLSASGTLIPKQGFTLASIDGRLYDGTVSGNLNIGWAKAWSIAGKLAIQSVEIQPFVALLTQDTTISGRLTANPVVDMRAPTAAQISDALHVESDFKVENGVLYNMNLSNAPMALLNKDALKGGETRFDKFSGHLNADSAGYHLTRVEIASGVLTAEAEMSITPRQELSGQVEVAVKGISGFVSTPLALSGTVQNPLLYPSKTALAGESDGNKRKSEPAKTEVAKQTRDQAAAAKKRQPSAAHTGR